MLALVYIDMLIYLSSIYIGPDDYTSQIQIVTFRSQDSTQSVRVPILDDPLAERVERFAVILIPIMESVVLSTDRRQATVEIIDNDGRRNIFTAYLQADPIS